LTFMKKSNRFKSYSTKHLELKKRQHDQKD
jgi:hypothetical protein